MYTVFWVHWCHYPLLYLNRLVYCMYSLVQRMQMVRVDFIYRTTELHTKYNYRVVATVQYRNQQQHEQL